MTLEYGASASCPDEASFRAQITARVPVTFAPDAPRRLTVATELAEAVRGRITLKEGSASVMRELSGTTCDEVVAALALIAAVLLEGASDDHESGAPSSPASPLPAPNAVPTATPAPAERAAPPANPSGVTMQDESPRRSVVRWGAAVHGDALGGVGPGIAFGVRAAAEVALRIPLEPTLRISGAWTPGTDRSTSLGAVHFALAGGRLEACPVRWPLARWNVTPCGLFDVARVSGEATGSAVGQRGRLWVAPGLLARLGLSVTSFVELELEGGVTFPLLRYRFLYTPDPVVYHVPIATGFGGAGAAVRFP